MIDDDGLTRIRAAATALRRHPAGIIPGPAFAVRAPACLGGEPVDAIAFCHRPAKEHQGTACEECWPVVVTYSQPLTRLWVASFNACGAWADLLEASADAAARPDNARLQRLARCALAAADAMTPPAVAPAAAIPAKAAGLPAFACARGGT